MHCYLLYQNNVIIAINQLIIHDLIFFSFINLL